MMLLLLLKNLMAKQLWIAVQLLEGNDSPSWSTASISFPSTFSFPRTFSWALSTYTDVVKTKVSKTLGSFTPNKDTDNKSTEGKKVMQDHLQIHLLRDFCMQDFH